MMRNTDLADHLADKLKMSKADARQAVDGMIEAITMAAIAGDEIALNGFGKFKVKDNPAREGRNPSTGKPIKIAASKKLTFSPSKTLKDRLNA
jgi:DNA-binding protein HU-beta